MQNLLEGLLSREQGLKEWLARQLPGTELNVQALSGDASFRRYYRVIISQAKDHRASAIADSCLIAVDAPPQTEKNREFVSIAKHLHQHGVNVPQVQAYDYQQGYLLLSDLGDQLLLPLLNENSADSAYQSAIELLISMQRSDVDALSLPHYSAELLNAEMTLFLEWFIAGLLGYSLSFEERAMIEALFQKLIDSAQEQPQVFVHRDYHSRNIMQSAEGELATIDFQDAVIGPISYDLVSLLRDCYVSWPESCIEQWLAYYQQQAQQQGVIQSVEAQHFRRWFDLMGLQRHIKVLGIFARLYQRDGKAAYLNDLPLVINYILSVANNYPEFGDFCFWFREKLLPIVEQQPWGQGSAFVENKGKA